ncbi:MAG: thermonuclease family protein [Nanoarchaeota archaeon]|nr:thermonuclease family protein [Nanoarchaeota archaeon]
MKEKQKGFLILLILVLALIALNYPIINSLLEKSLDEKETGLVERIVDGDTLVVNGEKVRMLGINTPEKGEYLSDKAQEFLETTILNETVELEFGKDIYDLYGRKLAYVIYKKRNINQESVEQGFSNFYFPSGKDKYYENFVNSWEKCLSNEINLCEPSQDVCKTCISVEEWNIENQLLILKNLCDFSCDLTSWTIKDEGRKKFTFDKTFLGSGEEYILTPKDFNKDYIWTKSGDSIFIRDDKNKLVYWESY